jgi:hypothetical protein
MAEASVDGGPSMAYAGARRRELEEFRRDEEALGSGTPAKVIRLYLS